MSITPWDAIDYLRGGTDNELAKQLGDAAEFQAYWMLNRIKPIAEREGEALLKKLGPMAAEQAEPAADKIWSALQDKANEEFSFEVLGFTVTPKMLAIGGAVAVGVLVAIGVVKAVRT